MNLARLAFTTLALAALVAIAPGQASALVSVGSPFSSGTSVTIWIGSDAATNRPLACYSQSSEPLTREKVYVSASTRETAFMDDVQVLGSAASDTLFVVVAPTATPCGLMGVLNQNGWQLFVRGGAGNDTIRGGTAPNTFLLGEEGNDIVSTTADFGVAMGGSGDDSVLGISPFSTRECLLGEDGNDCLYDANALATTISGGNGVDSSPLYLPLVGMPPSARCGGTTGSCDVESFSLLCLP
jgi:Ca2+-binding RTX toxin-like protein